MTRFLAAVARRRRAVLAAALALSAGCLLVQARVSALGERAFPWLMAVSVGCLVLVRREGLFANRRRMRTDTVDPRFLCAAIRHYAVHPEHRSAIGTRAEYERRMPELMGALDWSPP